MAPSLRGKLAPWLQLILAGGAIFVVSQALDRRGDLAEQRQRVELTESDLREIRGSWLGQGRPPPSDEEMRNLVELRIREEILAREAVTLGLDKGDAIVRQRLAQKMAYLVDDVADLREPTEDELRAWLASHRARFAVPARVSFHQLYFSTDRRGARARADAATALRSLGSNPPDSAMASALGDPFVLERAYSDRSIEEVAAQFGPAFAAELPRLPAGGWQGPLESGYGWHVVWVDGSVPERTPDLGEIEAEVRSAWSEEQRVELRRRAYEAIRARYAVVVPADTDERALDAAREGQR